MRGKNVSCLRYLRKNVIKELIKNALFAAYSGATMAETSLHPRPEFSTFLQSDANRGGDGLSYHDYRRALRYNKVAMLQQKKARSHIPGYKKRPVTMLQAVTASNYQNAAKTNIPMSRSLSSGQFGKIDPQFDSNEGEARPFDSEVNPPESIPEGHIIPSGGRSSIISDVGEAAGDKNLQRVVSAKQQRIKSATTRSHHKKAPDICMSIAQQPGIVLDDIRDVEPHTGVEGNVVLYVDI